VPDNNFLFLLCAAVEDEKRNTYYNSYA